jgi:hypothetical protein
MALTVEDGTGLSGADAFVSLAYFKAYCDKRGKDYSSYADAVIEQAIVRATDYLSESVAWQGYRVKPRTDDAPQALSWPRHNVVDREGYVVAYDEVPEAIQRATCELAFYELGSPGGMQPVFTANERVKSEKVGPIAIEYDTSANGTSGARPVLLAVMDLVGEFTSNTGGSMLSGRAVRA